MSCSAVIHSAVQCLYREEKKKQIKYFVRSATAVTFAQSIKRFCHNFRCKLLSCICVILWLHSTTYLVVAAVAQHTTISFRA